MNIISDYTVTRGYDFLNEAMIVRIPVFEYVTDSDKKNVLGYRSMTQEEVDEEILVSYKDEFMSLAEFKRKYILSLT